MRVGDRGDQRFLFGQPIQLPDAETDEEAVSASIRTTKDASRWPAAERHAVVRVIEPALMGVVAILQRDHARP